MNKPTDNPTAMTVRAAALKLDVTTETIYRWIREGYLTRFPVEGGAVLVEASEVERLVAERQAEPVVGGPS